MIAPSLEWLLPEPVRDPPAFSGFGPAVATLLARRGFTHDDQLQRFLQAGAGALHGVVVSLPQRRLGAGRSLVRHAAGELRARGARFAIAEVPDAPAVRDVLALLAADGFVEEARVADFYRDGVALAFMRRDL